VGANQVVLKDPELVVADDHVGEEAWVVTGMAENRDE
jgi:hypothetical protein